MSKLEKIKNIIKQNKFILSKKYKVKEIGIFGSFVRNEQKNNSDIDVLVEFSEPVGFFDFLDLEEELKKMLGHKIDLVSKKALKPNIGKYILQEVIFV